MENPELCNIFTLLILLLSHDLRGLSKKTVPTIIVRLVERRVQLSGSLAEYRTYKAKAANIHQSAENV